MAKIEDFVNVCLAEDLKVMIDVSLSSNLSLEVVVDYVTTLFSKTLTSIPKLLSCHIGPIFSLVKVLNYICKQ